MRFATMTAILLLVRLVLAAPPKVVEEFTPTHIAKVIGYLAITNLHLALPINFKFSDLRWKRVVR